MIPKIEVPVSSMGKCVRTKGASVFKQNISCLLINMSFLKGDYWKFFAEDVINNSIKFSDIAGKAFDIEGGDGDSVWRVI